MYRVFTLIINLVAALSVDSVFQTGITLNIEAPSEVTAGNEFEVHVTIQKGDLASFSRLQQSFPAGLTAKPYLSSNADFSFESKRVRMIWLRLPKEKEITLVYKIKVDERLKGSFNIKALFSYIDNNERKSVSYESSPIIILPSSAIDQSLVVDINDYEQKVIPYISPAIANSEIACVRQKPTSDNSGKSFIVRLLVNKGSRNKFAKIEEKVPAGYKAVSIDPKEAIFTFKNSTAKFLWMNLPSSPYFVVSYKLIPLDNKVTAPQPKGKFSYLEEEKTFSIDIKQTDNEVASLSPDEVSKLLGSLSSAPLLAHNELNPKNNEVTNEKYIAVNTETRPTSKQKHRRQERLQTKELKKNLAYLLEPDSGVYYRVQVAAGHKTVAVEQYFKKYSLDKEVKKEFHEGWIKYSIGSFPVYKEARDYRVHVWNTTILSDAFVSAYNNGKRITVQEALMIANQKWYK
jgi:hypothetical protein